MRLVTVDDHAFEGIWEELAASEGFRYPLYGKHNIDYYRAYFDQEFEDLSFVVESAGEAVAGLRWSRRRDSSGGVVLNCFGLPTLYVTKPGLASRTRRDAAAALRAETNRILAEGPHRVEHRDFLIDGALSDFSRHLLGLGAAASPVYSQVIDLERTEAQLHSDLSKSFRWNVNWGAKHLSLRTVSGPDAGAADIDALRVLHREAAGRQTRPDATWLRQLDMIRSGEAFLVIGSVDDQPVSAALFSASSTYCFYGVSASRRDLFDKPISHVLVWEALLHAKRIGCRWFETGEQLLGVPDATDKERGISAFKRGFGGVTRVRLSIRLERASAGNRA